MQCFFVDGENLSIMIGRIMTIIKIKVFLSTILKLRLLKLTTATKTNVKFQEF